MAILTLTTTPAQDRALAWKLARVNEQRLRESKPDYPSVEAWVRDFVRDQFQPFFAEFKDVEGRAVAVAYADASAATQATVRTTLGVVP